MAKDLTMMAEDHRRFLLEIEQIKRKDMQLQQATMQEIILQEAWDLLTINWKKLMPPKERR